MTDQDEYEKRLTNLVSKFVSDFFSDFRSDPSLLHIRVRSKGGFNCESKVRDFFLLQDLKEKFSEPVTKRTLYPGSLLRWLYVHSSRYYLPV